MKQAKTNFRKHPPWLKVPFPGGDGYHNLKKLVQSHSLHTVCESAHCPNIGECWENGTATFMILGEICTRRCGFCAVQTGRPIGYDLGESLRVAHAVRTLQLRHAVITSVDRDDLQDEGSNVFAQTIVDIRKTSPATKVEVLIPDFRKDSSNLDRVIQAKPDVLAHNLDTVRRLFAKVKPRGSYNHSLELLKYVKKTTPAIKTKAGFMLGLGEEFHEIVHSMQDMKSAGVDILTIGQYLRPSSKHLPLIKYYRPEEFRNLKMRGEAMGIPHVESGPLVRSSYHAAEQVDDLLTRDGQAFKILQ